MYKVFKLQEKLDKENREFFLYSIVGNSKLHLSRTHRCSEMEGKDYPWRESSEFFEYRHDLFETDNSEHGFTFRELCESEFDDAICYYWDFLTAFEKIEDAMEFVKTQPPRQMKEPS